LVESGNRASFSPRHIASLQRDRDVPNTVMGNYQAGLVEALDQCAEDPDAVEALRRLAVLVADGLLHHSNGCVIDGEDVGVLHAVVTALCHAIGRETPEAKDEATPPAEDGGNVRALRRPAPEGA
jgi:hypothetical protein